jgi:hypothetical protein
MQGSASLAFPRAAAALVVSLLFVVSCSLKQAGEDSGFYPGKLGIARAKNLSPRGREIEARFAAYLEDHTDEALVRYQKKYGKEINTDNARELSPDYAPGGTEAEDTATRDARARWSAAVHEPSSAFTKEIFRRELKKPAAANERNQVIFTAGGAGVGKTSSIHQVAGLEEAVAAAQIVYDTTLSSLKSSLERVSQALEAGKQVSIIYVYRDPVESFTGGALPRAERNGRTLPLDAYIETHLGAPEVLLKIADVYKGDARLAIAIIDNSRGRGGAAVSDLSFVRSVAGKYTRDELRTKLARALEDAYEKGKRGEKDGISEVIYRGFKGDVS